MRKKFPTFGEKSQAGLSKLHSTCPEEHFEEKMAFWKSLIFVMIFGL